MISYNPKGELLLGKVEGQWKTKFKYAAIIWHSKDKEEHIKVLPFDKESEIKVQLTKKRK